MRESPTYLGLKELPIMDQIPTKALHILGGGGVEVYFDWCIIASSWLHKESALARLQTFYDTFYENLLIRLKEKM